MVETKVVGNGRRINEKAAQAVREVEEDASRDWESNRLVPASRCCSPF